MIDYFRTDPMVQAMGWTLVHSLWQAISMAILLRLVLAFTPLAFAKLRYAFSLSAVGLVFLTSVLTFQQHYRVERAALDIKIATKQLPAVEAVAMPVDGPAVVTTYDVGASFWFELNRRIQNLIPLLPVIVLLWLGGTILLMFWLGFSWWNANRLTLAETTAVPQEWLERLTALRQKMGIKRPVGLFFSPRVTDALTLKHVKPVILLPIGILNALSTEEVEAILLHELAHIRRWDYLVNCFQLALEVLFFYHPAVWWMARQVRESREHCCDDLALQLGGSDRMQYAQALTSLTAFSFTHKTPFAMTATGQNKDFTVRIKRLFGIQPTRTLGKSFLSASLAGLLLLVFTFSARAELLEFMEDDGRVEEIAQPVDTSSIDATLEEFLLAWLYKEPAFKGKKMALNAPLEGGLFIHLNGSSGSIYDENIPLFFLNGQQLPNPGNVKVPAAIGQLDLQTIYTIGLVRGEKSKEYGINDLDQKLVIVATNEWAAENLPKPERKDRSIKKEEEPKVYTDSMLMEIKYYMRSGDMFMGGNIEQKPITVQFKISQEDNPTSYPIYILNGKEVSINRYGKFPSELRKVQIDSLVIMNEELAASRYGERGQEAGVYLLYDKLEGEKPIGQLSQQQLQQIESSIQITTAADAPEMALQFELPIVKPVNLQVLNEKGELIKQLANGWKLSGKNEFTWRPAEGEKGTYTLRLQIGDEVIIKMFTL